MQVCTIARGHTVVIASGRPLRPSQTDDEHVGDAAVLDLGEHRQPELRALAAVAGPQPEDVAFAGAGDPDRDVDRPVGDLAVADLDDRSRR